MKCKYCNSENLILEKRSKDNKHILDAQQVALICGDCGKYIKWCPKDERKFYWVKMKTHENNLEEENAQLKETINAFQQNKSTASVVINTLKQQLAEKDKEIENLKEDNNWYSMWHKKFKKEIEDLKTELETYRPTHLKGNGQCQCAICKQRTWTNWCIAYDGKTYCDKCFKQVETRDDKLRHQICKKIKENSLFYTAKIKGVLYAVMKREDLKYILDQIEKGE